VCESVGETVMVRSHIEQLVIVQRISAACVDARCKRSNFVGALDPRPGIEQHRVRPGENRRDGGNPDGESQNRQCGKRRVPFQLSQRESQVFEHRNDLSQNSFGPALE